MRSIAICDLNFRLLCKGFGDKVVLFFKHLRKNTGKKFRYLLVFEKHKSDNPHAHMLNKSEIQDEWDRYGFANVRLLKEDLSTARYVCKYLLKEGSKGIRVKSVLSLWFT